MSTGYQLNTHADYGYIANRETVTLYDKAGSVQCTVISAKRLMQDLGERAPSDGNYLRTAIDWRLPGDNVSGTVTPGCTILSFENLASIVLAVDPPGAYKGTWNCECQALMVMGYTVQRLEVNQTTNEYADRITDPTTYPVGGTYVAAIQPADASVLDLLGKRGFENHFTIYILTTLDLTYGDLIVDTASGTKYKIVAWRSKRELDEAFTILAEIQP